MKSLFILLASAVFLMPAMKAQNVGIGTSTPNANAALEIKSNTKGLLMPRLSTTARNNMTNVAKGMLVYDTTLSGFYYHDGSSWTEIVSTATQPWNNYIVPETGKKIIYANANTYSFQGGTSTGALSSNAGIDGSVLVFQPGLFNLLSYLNIDGTSIQARQSSLLNGKIEMPLKLNPFGGNIGVGLGATLPTAKFHLAGNMKIDGNNTLEFGAGILGKDPNSGKIGYQVFGNADALDIVGAGQSIAARKINLYADGGLTVVGSIATPVRFVTTNVTLTNADHTVLCDLQNNSSLIISINLPAATAQNQGREYKIVALNMPSIVSGNIQNGIGGYVNVFGNMASIISPFGYPHNLYNIYNEGGTFGVTTNLLRSWITYISYGNKWYISGDNYNSDSY